MTYSQRKKVYLKAIEEYGESSQCRQAIEEMSELTKELCKFWRPGGQNIPAITEEMADVKIMLEQLEMIFCNSQSVEKQMEEKVKRLEVRIREDS